MAEGNTLQEALSHNDAVALALRDAFPQLRMASLSLLFPSLRTQEAGRDLWNGFWNGERSEPRTRPGAATRRSAWVFEKTPFSPFEAAFHAPVSPITPETLQEAGLGFLETLFRPNVDSDSPLLLTFLPRQRPCTGFFHA